MRFYRKRAGTEGDRDRVQGDRDRTDGKSPKQISSVSLVKKGISIVLQNVSEKREAFD